MTSIAPWLQVADANEALDFYAAAFGAIVLERLDDEAGNAVVALLGIDGADFWVHLEEATGPDALGDPPVRLILTVGDPHSVVASALKAGATQMSAVAEGNGWLVGRLVDPFGHQWEVGRRLPA